MPVSKREILPGGRSPALRLERYADSLGEPEGETPRQVLDVLLANPSGSTPGRARPSRPCQTLDANDANDANLRPTMPTKAIEANKRRDYRGGTAGALSRSLRLQGGHKLPRSCHALATPPATPRPRSRWQRYPFSSSVSHLLIRERTGVAPRCGWCVSAAKAPGRIKGTRRC